MPRSEACRCSTVSTAPPCHARRWKSRLRNSLGNVTASRRSIDRQAGESWGTVRRACAAGVYPFNPVRAMPSTK